MTLCIYLSKRHASQLLLQFTKHFVIFVVTRVMFQTIFQTETLIKSSFFNNVSIQK